MPLLPLIFSAAPSSDPDLLLLFLSGSMNLGEGMEHSSDRFADENYLISFDSEVVLPPDDEVEKLALSPSPESQLFPVQPENPRTRPHRATRRRPKRSRKKSPGRPLLEWEKWEEDNEKWVAAVEAEGDGECSDESPLLREAMEPSEDVILPLLRFQKEWLAWALKQEDSDAQGGILADEMGMGKTIQAISLVLTARSLVNRRHDSSDEFQFRSNDQDPMPRTKCSLVICPVAAVIQWVGEIETHSAKGRVRVLVFHGPKRSSVDYNFHDYDFVITTYSTIENDYRKYMMPPKEEGEEKTFNCMNADLHSKKNNEGISSRKKKIVRRCMECEESINNMAAGLRRKSALHSVQWERIILDEAHFIKDKRCNTARAVFALHSLYKWALSGTPLQNRAGELYSLVRFIQIDPYSFYLCTDCDCKVLDYGSTKDCLNCPHSTVRHFSWWNRYISKPIENAYNGEQVKHALILLKKKILSSILLRRTKLGRASDLAFPPRMVTLRRDSFDKNEGEFYESLYTKSRLQFGIYAEAGTLMKNYAHIFDLLTRLRQAVDHPYLVLYSNAAEVSSGGTDDTNKFYCVACHDPTEDWVVASCNHIFCKGCLIEYSSASGNMLCPTCGSLPTVDLTAKWNSGGKTSAPSMKTCKSSRIFQRIDKEDFKTSTKIDALKEDIRNMIESDGSAKGIVFSQFTSFLDLIDFSLQQSGIRCVKLVGSMSLAKRQKTINTFNDDANCKIFLMSLKAGGVALNLTVASNVFLMDPWWNPAVEQQAQDRIYRIGQFKPIKTMRYIIKNTVEERILRLQKRKELVFEGTFGNSAEAISKLTEDDLRFLFDF